MEKLVETLKTDLYQLKFVEYYNETADAPELITIIKQKGNFFKGLFGGFGLLGIIKVPNNINSSDELLQFYKNTRKAIVKNYAAVKIQKSMHSYLILLLSDEQYRKLAGIESELKDKTGLHVNIVQGVFLINTEKKEYITDHSKPLQHKKQYNTVKTCIDKWSN